MWATSQTLSCPSCRSPLNYTCWLVSCVPFTYIKTSTTWTALVWLTYGASCMKSTRKALIFHLVTITRHTFQSNCTQAFYKQQRRSSLQYVVACKLWGICVLVRDFFICDHVWSCGVSSWGFLIDCKHLSGNCLFYKRLKALSLSFNWNLVWF